MLGWEIFIKNEADETLATWVVGLGGLDWVKELAKQGQAELVLAGGYPTSYKLAAKHLLPFLKARQLPSYKGPLVIGDDYVREGGLNTGLMINEVTMFKCKDVDMLFFVAWDQS